MASIRKRGDNWQVQVRKQGHRPVVKTFAVKANALAWARKIESEIERGLISPNFGRSATTPLCSLIERYIETVTPRKKSRVQESNRLRRLSRASLSRLAVGNITSEDIAKFRDQRLAEVKSQAVRHDLNALSQVFTVAMREWGVCIHSNPVASIWKPALAPARERRLTEMEAITLINYLGANCHPDFRDLIEVALCTAMRKGEILRIRNSDFDRTQHLLRIPETKNGYGRTIPLCPKSRSILMRRSVTMEDLLFAFDLPWCRYHWDKMLVDTGIINLHFHDLRHEAISRFFERGLSVPEVALISGHKDYRMLARYTHLRAEDVAAKL